LTYSDCGRRKPLFAFDIPITEYALFNIKSFALFLAKKGMKMFEMVIGSSEEDDYVDQVWRRRDLVWSGQVSGDERHRIGGGDT